MGSLNKNTNYRKIAKEVIDLEIKALRKLKKALNKNFDKAVNAIVNCQSKVILCGVGKSGIIAGKISATLSSIGTPSFSLSANDCSHGNMGSISRKDVLILISYSGNSIELKNIINYANRNKVLLIGITSKKNSDLYKNSDIGLITPEVKEAGLEMIPTSSTINQLSIGDALAISTLKKKKINNLDFKKFHPAGSLGEKLKTAQDLMLTKEKIPFIDENKSMTKALKIMTEKKLGTLIVRNKKNYTTGIITDGQVRRFNLKNLNLKFLKVKDVMTKNPIKVDKDILATKALAIMNEKKITSLCVYENKKKFITVGILHIHNILNRKIY
ncbi:KpsF/GutQ family sugar-phosphate isomerase [Candidatus Pelagibacter sp. RS39]|uniref:KpsF/GutQ family sugar-phosphate isomerase n=1 Tax=Candidatus Pelagibacter sp. RS39 TaxID=1977864 RepID=UPI000A15808C|nr:KpsF/GutQ family sugar-phosphate isomerase [Candidatus Pelagibacter sp. RS39]ARJ47444.1 arabinose-5-phosphate isomerase [Candidatus Pelagibacter sp. RS39]